MAYADYDYYQHAYFGQEISKERFLHLSGMASAYLDRITSGRAKEYSQWDSVKLACCAVAEVAAGVGVGRVSSEMVGNWSRAYRFEDGSLGRRFYDAASLYLDGTGLLYRGCD